MKNYDLQFFPTKFKMSDDLETQILDRCDYINEKCDIDTDSFSISMLKNEQWYLEILSILCPYLEEELIKIHNLNNSEKAINELLRLINSLDEFNEDVTEIIHGKQVVKGNSEQISLMVQIFHTLVEAAIREQEDSPSNEEDEKLSKDENEIRSSSQVNESDKEQKTYLQKRQSGGKFQKSYSERHSVLGINNEFDKSENEDSDEFTANEKKKEKIVTHQSPNQNNFYQKNTSSEDRENSPHFYSENKKQTSENQSSNPYLHEKIQKTKKKQRLPLKKRNPEKDLLIYGSRKPKRLVEFPSKGNTLKKAKSSEEIKLTRQIQGKIKETQKKGKKKQSFGRMKSPVNDEIKRKKKELDYYSNEVKKMNKQRIGRRANRKEFETKNEENLRKLLNWREENMKKERKQYEMVMKARISNKKDQYIQKVNNLVLKLEKEKEIQEKKDFKENLIKENQEAVRRITSLEKWYKDKLDLMREHKKDKRSQQMLLKAGHKEIINQLERQLKKENEKKLLALTQQYRQEQANILTDYEELEDRIIKAYKKN